MHTDQRITALETRVAELEEKLYAANVLRRPEPKPVELPTTKAENIKIINPYAGAPTAVNLGVDLEFEYPCLCGNVHKTKVERITNLLWNSVRTHTTACPNDDELVMKVIVRIPKNPDAELLESALADQIS